MKTTYSFTKYHGTGNDFVMIDGRKLDLNLSQEQVKTLCNRRFGVGADGLIIIKEKEGFDFEMIYYNADGNLGSMCGNGGRCAIKYAHSLGLIKNTATFFAYDGIHKANILSDEKISLQMQNVTHFSRDKDAFVIDTGSPHYVLFAQDAVHLDVVLKGRNIRNSTHYKTDGINVNFAKVFEDYVYVRTYERGVEDETLSCGTGVVAVAICVSTFSKYKAINSYNIHTKGGHLTVNLKNYDNKIFTDIYLIGPATAVFEGNFTILENEIKVETV